MWVGIIIFIIIIVIIFGIWYYNKQDKSSLNITSKSVNGSKVMITWDPIPDATFEVQTGRVSGKYDKTYNTDKNSISLDLKDECGKFYFVVRAKGQACYGEFSKEETFDITFKAPELVDAKRQGSNVLVRFMKIVGVTKYTTFVEAGGKIFKTSNPEPTMRVEVGDVVCGELKVYGIAETAKCKSANSNIIVLQKESPPKPEGIKVVNQI